MCDQTEVFFNTEEDREYLDVLTFHLKFDMLNHQTPTHLTTRKMEERVACMQEELNEFIDAMGDADMPAMADALIDLVYFAKGTAVMMGLPWKELWDDVQKCNMAKVRGETHRGQRVDVKKPEGWVPPSTREILAKAGYNDHEWIEKPFVDDVGEPV